MRTQNNLSESLYVQIATKAKPIKILNRFFFVLQAIILLNEILAEENYRHIEKRLGLKGQPFSNVLFLIKELQKTSPLNFLNNRDFTELLFISLAIFVILSTILLFTSFLFRISWTPNSYYLKRILIELAILLLRGFETMSLFLICFWLKISIVRESWVESRKVTDTNSTIIGETIELQSEGGYSTFDELRWHSLISEKVEFLSFGYLLLCSVNFFSGILLLLIGLWEEKLATCLPLENFSNTRNFTMVLPKIYKILVLLIVWAGVLTWPRISPLMIYPLILALSILMLGYSWVTAGNYSNESTTEIIYIVKEIFNLDFYFYRM